MSRQGSDRDGEGPAKPVRETYDWFSIALFVTMLGTFIYALWSR